MFIFHNAKTKIRFSGELKLRDELANKILQKAFAGRKVVQIDCMPLHHDGAGVYCHLRNEPAARKIMPIIIYTSL